MIRSLLRRLTTDVDALRARIAELEADLASETRMHHRWKAEADRYFTENASLRILAGNTGATETEREVLAVVNAMPGALAKDVGLAVCEARATAGRAEWEAEHPGKAPPDWAWFSGSPGDSRIIDAMKPLSGLHKKGLVRREQAGRSYRYWPVTT